MTDQKSLVSIIIICYNHEKFIEEAIRSVFEQTYKKIALIVVDNNSTDGSRRVIERLPNKYTFRFIKQDNIGVPRTLNKIIPQLNGEYFVFFSGDDFLARNRIETQVNFMEANLQYAMCYSRTIFVDENSKELYRNINRLFKSGYLFNDFITFKFHPPAPTYFYRRDIFDKIGLYDERLFYIEDLYMNLKVAKHFPIGFIDDYLVFQRQHSNKLTNTVDVQEQLKEGLLIYQGYNRSLLHLYLQGFGFCADRNFKLAIKYMVLSAPFFYKKKYISAILSLAHYSLNKVIKDGK